MNQERAAWVQSLSDYGMVVVLLMLCAFFSAWTYTEQQPARAAGGAAVAGEIIRATPAGARVLIVVRDRAEDEEFAVAAVEALTAAGREVVLAVRGEPADARRVLRRLADAGSAVQAVAATAETGAWAVFEDLEGQYPAFRGVRVFVPPSYRWPAFLKATNLINIANQIAVIAILAIGMTLVVITGGIDLSVGSVAALAAVVAAWLIQEAAGGRAASVAGMVVCSLLALGLCGLIGLANGLLVAFFRVPAFIVTLGVMTISRGLAGRLSGGESVYQIPAGYRWLGHDAAFGVVPNSVVLMLALYLVAHVLMSRTVLGRYLYAIGGNAEAARLAGVPVRRVVVFAYVACSTLAGGGGIIMTSLLEGASPLYGTGYELEVIAAVVVGGTSLSGGEGKVFGTFIGALLIGVIHNGMNLLQITSWDQMVVMGSVIVVAVLLDRLKQHVWAGLYGGPGRG